MDIILTNNRRHVHSTEVFPMSLNDHDCAARIRKLNHHKESFRERSSLWNLGKACSIDYKVCQRSLCRPWLTFELNTLINSRDKILRKARKSKWECDWSCYRWLKKSCNNKKKGWTKLLYKSKVFVEEKLRGLKLLVQTIFHQVSLRMQYVPCLVHWLTWLTCHCHQVLFQSIGRLLK